MPVIEGKKAVEWIDEYVEKKEPKVAVVAKGLRALMKKTVKGVTESVNPWKIPTFEVEGPMSFFMAGKKHVTFGFLRGALLKDPAGLLEGTGKSLRHVKLRCVEDLKRPELKKLIGEAVRLNKKEPTMGMGERRKKM
jgi:hypothetical protein